MSFIEYSEPSDSIQVGSFGRVGPARNKEVAWLRERQKDISPDERGTIRWRICNFNPLQERLGSIRLLRKFFRYLGGPKKGETFAESWALFGPK